MFTRFGDFRIDTQRTVCDADSDIGPVEQRLLRRERETRERERKGKRRVT